MKGFLVNTRWTLFAHVMRLWFVGVIHAVCLLTANTSAAQEKTWRLEYRRSADAPSNCPDENYLHTALRAKNGARNPFSQDASQSITIDIAPTTERIEARIQARDEHGVIVSESVAHAPLWRCDQLADRVVFILRDIVDPVILPNPAPKVLEPEQPAVEESKEESTKLPIREQAKRFHVNAPLSSYPRLSFSLGIGASWWNAPNTAFTSLVGIGVRWSPFSIGIEGRYDAAAELPLVQSVRAGQMAAAIVACGYPAFSHPQFYARGCLIVDLTRLTSEINEVHTFAYASTVIHFGARVGAGLALSRAWSIELNGDGIVATQQPRFIFNDGEQWRLPRFNGALRATVVGTFDVFSQPRKNSSSRRSNF